STVGLLAVVAAVLSSGAALWVFAAVAAGLLAALPIVLSIVGERRHRRYGNTPTVAQIGSAIAEALHALDLSTAGAAAARRPPRHGHPPTVAQVVPAIAEALHALDLSTAGADAVRMRIDARGDLRCHLDADPASAEVFAHAFDEAVSPIADPRYLLPCWRLPEIGRAHV